MGNGRCEMFIIVRPAAFEETRRKTILREVIQVNPEHLLRLCMEPLPDAAGM